MSGSAKIILAILLVSIGVTTGQDIPTLIPPPDFNPDNDASNLDDAMSGLGTDEDQIISVLCYRSFDQRVQVTNSYSNRYGNLISDFESELSGDFLTLMTSLTYSKSTYLAIQLNEVMAGPGTDEPALTEVLISRTNQELEEVRNTYAAYFGTPLVNALEAELSGSLKDLLTQISQGSRDESTVIDSVLAAQDVQTLYDGGEGMVDGTDETAFVNIFATRSWLQIQEMANLYDATYGSLESAIVSEFVGDIENSLISIVRYSRNKAAYFAARFFVSINGAGTADRDLRRLTVSRCETDLGNIKIEYQNIYSIPLSTAVSDDTSGDYRSALLALIG